MVSGVLNKVCAGRSFVFSIKPSLKHICHLTASLPRLGARKYDIIIFREKGLIAGFRSYENLFLGAKRYVFANRQTCYTAEMHSRAGFRGLYKALMLRPIHLSSQSSNKHFNFNPTNLQSNKPHQFSSLTMVLLNNNLLVLALAASSALASPLTKRDTVRSVSI